MALIESPLHLNEDLPAAERNSRRAGFSLISVVVAILLLSIGALAFMQTAYTAMAMENLSSTRSSALGIALSHMEFLRSNDPALVSSESPVKVNERGEIDANGVFEREVKVEDVSDRLRKITVLVAFPGGPNPIEIATLGFERRP